VKIAAIWENPEKNWSKLILKICKIFDSAFSLANFVNKSANNSAILTKN